MSRRLARHIAEPFVEIALGDAHQRGIEPASLVRVRSSRGSILARALVTNAQRTCSVFTPMHWTGGHASNAVVSRLVAPSTDPVSGQPGLKYTEVEIEPAGAAWYGFAVIRARPAHIPCDYWAVARTRSGFRIELAGLAPLTDPASFAVTLLGTNQSSLLSYRDNVSGRHRFAVPGPKSIEGLLFLSPEPVAVARDWIADEFDASSGSRASVQRLLAGRPSARWVDDGAVLCVCNAVGIKRIAAAIAAGATTIAAVGTSTSAGLNCGSCRPEIKRVLALGSGSLHSQNTSLV
jgi:assimilatory nitrate reductase catalytic subunit